MGAPTFRLELVWRLGLVDEVKLESTRPVPLGRVHDFERQPAP
jgi:hypothetical protein